MALTRQALSQQVLKWLPERLAAGHFERRLAEAERERSKRNYVQPELAPQEPWRLKPAVPDRHQKLRVWWERPLVPPVRGCLERSQ